ncbi:MAG: Gfo/Idh/MocA family protein [Hyphomonadaceae bacterium]|jgi:predicted dehydrogenase
MRVKGAGKSLLKVGLIGAGVAGERHAAALRVTLGANLLGLYEPDVRRSEGLCARFGIEPSSLETLLEQADAVIIAAPAGTHGRLSLQALAQGCHVLVERPIATSRDEAQQMVAEARAKNLILQVGHREGPMIGALGLTPSMVGLRSFEAVREAPPREHVSDVSVILDLMIQDIYVAAVLFGSRAVSVRATKLGGRGAAIDSAEARVRFKGGGEARLRATRTASVRTTQWMLDTGQAQAQMSVDFVRGVVTHGANWPSPRPFLAQDSDPVAQMLAQFVAACSAPYAEVSNQEALTAMDLALQIETILSANL